MRTDTGTAILHHMRRVGRITSRRGVQRDQEDDVRVQQERDALRASRGAEYAKKKESEKEGLR